MHTFFEKILFNLSKIETKLFFVTFLICNFSIIFLLDSVFWDDWTIYNQSKETIINTFNNAGYPPTAYIHLFFLKIGLPSYRLTLLFLILIQTACFNEIIKTFKIFGKQERVLIVFLFAFSPVFASKIAIINFPSYLYLTLFFLGWYLIKKNKILSGIFFFLSFGLQSLLVFYAIPILGEMYKNKIKSFRALIQFAQKYLLLIILPFLWYALKEYLFPLQGPYVNYQEFSILNLIKAPFMQVFYTLFQSVNLSLLIILFLLSIFIFNKHKVFTVEEDSNYTIIVISLLILVLSLFPYWITGHIPANLDWLSRHQILMAIPIALLITSLIKLRKFNNYQPIIFCFFIALFLSKNIENNIQLVVDWQKQKEIISFFSKEKIKIDSSTVITFTDSSQNAFDRRYRFYEYNGLIKYATGEEMAFSLPVADLSVYESGTYDIFFNSDYNARDHIRSDKPNLINAEITRNSFSSILNSGNLYKIKLQ